MIDGAHFYPIRLTQQKAMEISILALSSLKVQLNQILILHLFVSGVK